MDFYAGGNLAEMWRQTLGGAGLIDDSCPLHLYLVQREGSEDDTATHHGIDESDTEDEDDAGPWRIGTSMRRATELG